jgi:chromate transporter
VARPSLRALAALFFKIGNKTFGSGNTTMVLLGREMIERRWLEQWQFDLYYTLARVVPGTNVLAFVASAAHAVRGWPGTIAAMAALSIPASSVIILLTLGYQRWHEHPVGGAFITAAMSAIVGIIAGASWLMAWPQFRRGRRARTAGLVLGGVVFSFWLTPLKVLVLAAAIGWFWRGTEEGER